ncbi:MAG: hypothetical protein ACQCN6_09875 [Candidatus Bathyarchaeia archaeon]|jgi:hypothetical protein
MYEQVSEEKFRTRFAYICLLMLLLGVGVLCFAYEKWTLMGISIVMMAVLAIVWALITFKSPWLKTENEETSLFLRDIVSHSFYCSLTLKDLNIKREVKHGGSAICREGRAQAGL